MRKKRGRRPRRDKAACDRYPRRDDSPALLHPSNSMPSFTVAPLARITSKGSRPTSRKYSTIAGTVASPTPIDPISEDSTTASIAPIARAALAEDAPAVGAAILPFSDRFLPTRFALMTNALEV